MLFRKGYSGYAAENKRPGQRTDAFCGLCHGGSGGGAAACEGRRGTGPPVFHCHGSVCAEHGAAVRGQHNAFASWTI